MVFKSAADPDFPATHSAKFNNRIPRQKAAGRPNGRPAPRAGPLVPGVTHERPAQHLWH